MDSSFLLIRFLSFMPKKSSTLFDSVYPSNSKTSLRWENWKPFGLRCESNNWWLKCTIYRIMFPLILNNSNFLDLRTRKFGGIKYLKTMMVFLITSFSSIIPKKSSTLLNLVCHSNSRASLWKENQKSFPIWYKFST